MYSVTVYKSLLAEHNNTIYPCEALRHIKSQQMFIDDQNFSVMLCF